MKRKEKNQNKRKQKFFHYPLEVEGLGQKRRYGKGKKQMHVGVLPVKLLMVVFWSFHLHFCLLAIPPLPYAKVTSAIFQ